MTHECKGDKFEYISRVKAIARETKDRVQQRLTYEQGIMSVWQLGLTREQERKVWQDYIEFEIQQGQPKRAKLLYERALISLDKDTQFWLQYVRFIEKGLRDP
jgi:pre-mRNA-processing factor 39